jgi:cation diffusion facilitator family transporter
MIDTRHKIRIALYSVLVGVTLTLIKFTVGVISGSLGILSEALHSLLDLVAALITFFSVRLSTKPPDEQHQYGHGKVENLSALAEALLLLGTCVWIVIEAVGRLSGKSHHVEASLWAFLIMAVSLGLDVFISRLLSQGAKKYASQALEADALHYSSDILSSAVVIAGLVGVRAGMWYLDAIAALGVAALVAVASIRLSMRAVGELLDRAPAGLRETVVRRIQGIPSIKKVEDIRVRQSGSATFIDLVVSAGRLLSLRGSHDLADRIEAEVKAIVPGSEVLVHFHPSSEDESLLETVHAVAEKFPEIHEVHNITGYREDSDGGVFLGLHVKLSLDLSIEEAHRIVDLLEDELKKELPEVREIQTHIETLMSTGKGTKSEMEPKSLKRLNREILKDGRIREIHDVFVHRSGSGVMISCHVTTGSELRLAEAHEAATRVEERIKSLFPDCGYVIVHAEPESHP